METIVQWYEELITDPIPPPYEQQDKYINWMKRAIPAIASNAGNGKYNDIRVILDREWVTRAAPHCPEFEWMLWIAARMADFFSSADEREIDVNTWTFWKKNLIAVTDRFTPPSKYDRETIITALHVLTGHWNHVSSSYARQENTEVETIQMICMYVKQIDTAISRACFEAEDNLDFCIQAMTATYGIKRELVQYAQFYERNDITIKTPPIGIEKNFVNNLFDEVLRNTYADPELIFESIKYILYQYLPLFP
jgi:hypothetical protein